MSMFEIKLFVATYQLFFFRKIFQNHFDEMNFEKDFEFNMSLFLPELEKRTQFEWFTECVFGAFGYEYAMPVNQILTKYGICFSFNIQPAKSMFHLDK